VPEIKYSLHAVLVHEGSTTRSGHYTAFVKNSNQIWHHMDDERVRTVKSDTVLSQRAYVLFYTRNAPKIARKLPPPMPIGQTPAAAAQIATKAQQQHQQQQQLLQQGVPADEPKGKKKKRKKQNQSEQAKPAFFVDFGATAKRRNPGDDEEDLVPLQNSGWKKPKVESEGGLKRTDSLVQLDSWEGKNAEQKKIDAMRAREEEKEMERRTAEAEGIHTSSAAVNNLLTSDVKKKKNKKKKNKKRPTMEPAEVEVEGSGVVVRLGNSEAVFKSDKTQAWDKNGGQQKRLDAIEAEKMKEQQERQNRKPLLDSELDAGKQKKVRKKEEQVDDGKGREAAKMEFDLRQKQQNLKNNLKGQHGIKRGLHFKRKKSKKKRNPNKGKNDRYF
jgi:hypothetical protein